MCPWIHTWSCLPFLIFIISKSLNLIFVMKFWRSYNGNDTGDLAVKLWQCLRALSTNFRVPTPGVRILVTETFGDWTPGDVLWVADRLKTVFKPHYSSQKIGVLAWLTEPPNTTKINLLKWVRTLIITLRLVYTCEHRYHATESRYFIYCLLAPRAH